VWSDSPLTNFQQVEVINGQAQFRFLAPGTYTFYAYNIAQDGRASRVVSASAEAVYTDIPLHQPVVVSALQLGTALQVRIQNLPERNIAGAEVKYTRGSLTANLTDLAVITEDDWETADEMNTLATIPRDNQPIYVESPFPVSKSFRVFLLLLTNFSTMSPFAEVGLFRYELQATATENMNSFPSWPGSFENMVVWPHTENRRLLADPANRDAITFEEWNGMTRVAAPTDDDPEATELVEAWPFGEITGYGQTYMAPNLGATPPVPAGSTAYRTRIYDLGESSATREITVAITTDSPDGTDLTATQFNEQFDLYLRHSIFEGLASPTLITVTNGLPVLLSARTCQAFVHMKESRSRAIVSLTVAWRDIV